MSGVATAIAGAAIIGAVTSSKASGKTSKATAAGVASAEAATTRATNKAREDLFKLFPAAQENAAAGFQSALDVFGQSLPAQSQVFQQGNVAAQQQLLSGLPQFQNAILGGNVDFSQLQPTQLQQPDLSFFQQQLPQQQAPQFSDLFAQGAQNAQADPAGPLVTTRDPLSGIFGGRSNRFGPSGKAGGPGSFFDLAR